MQVQSQIFIAINFIAYKYRNSKPFKPTLNGKINQSDLMLPFNGQFH